VGVADGVEVGDLAVAVVVVVAFEIGVVVALDTVALAVEVGVAVVVTLDEVELATTMLDDEVAAGVADDVGAGVGVDEADTLDAGVTATI